MEVVTRKDPVLHPSQFRVNEAWIVFKLNDEPLRTEGGELFNCVCLMDAASCFMLANVIVSVDDLEPSTMEARSLLEEGWAHKQELPTTLFIPTGQFESNLPEEAERQGIKVVRVQEVELMPFIRAARLGFKHYDVARQARYN